MAAEELLGLINEGRALEVWERIEGPEATPEPGDYVTCSAVAGFVLKIQGATAWILVRSVYFPRGRERGVALLSLRGKPFLRRRK